MTTELPMFFEPRIPKRDLKALARRRDAHGVVRFSVWLAACAISGAWVAVSANTGWIVLALFTHGILLSFSYAISHECAHGTAFRSRRLNEAIFWFSSLVFGEEPIYRRYAHASHHSSTWYRSRDCQMPYYNPLTVRTYVSETVGLPFFWQNIKRLLGHSLGRFDAETRNIVPTPEWHKMQRNSAIFLSVYTSLLAATVLFDTYLALVLYFVPRIIGSPFMNLYINTQHMAMEENVPDHRYSTRSIRCHPLGRWFYWNMNYHIEHHLFPMVPFYALPALSNKISLELPLATKGVFAANFSILAVILKQRTIPRTVEVPEFPDSRNPLTSG